MSLSQKRTQVTHKNMITHLKHKSQHTHEGVMLQKMVHVAHIWIWWCVRYRVAKTHRMPYLYSHFPQKNPIVNVCCGIDLQLKASYGSSPPCMTHCNSKMTSRIRIQWPYAIHFKNVIVYVCGSSFLNYNDRMRYISKMCRMRYISKMESKDGSIFEVYRIRSHTYRYAYRYAWNHRIQVSIFEMPHTYTMTDPFLKCMRWFHKKSSEMIYQAYMSHHR